MFSFVLTYGIAWVSGSRSIGLIAWVLVILFTSIGFFVDFNLKNVYVSDCAKFSLVLCLWTVYYMDTYAYYFPEKAGARGWEDSPVTWQQVTHIFNCEIALDGGLDEIAYCS